MTLQTTASQSDIRRNGVNVTALFDTIDTVRADPALGAFRFRADNAWRSGGHNRSSIRSFYGCGKEDASRQAPFVLDADEPPILLGEDRAANPVEFVLHALAACLTTTLAYHAAARGIEIGSIESSLEGDLDLRGFLGISDEVRRGFSEVRVHMKVAGAASPDQLRELAAFSPVYDIVSNSLPVRLSFQSC
ncbi:MAG: OsmC family protein [Xanthomonadales bacterium]|nr:OsmC family protein [Xanthomonadales bacterium]